MATLTTASDSNKTIVTVEKISHVLDKIGISLTPDESVQWHDIIASVQESIEIVQDLPDYFPPVDLDKYPRINVHRPRTHENEGNAWAWKSHIQGKAGGPLSGVTFCLKDNITVKDVPMLLGTDMFTDYTPQTDATLVTRILEAGGTILGKAVCENLSLCASSFSAATGPVENPYAVGYTTGGSSSGCGYLVGSGKVDAGIGGDQGGSIRFPSSYCGIVGMKPTWGLVPWTGVVTHDAVHDTAGPMTKTVALNAKVLQAIAGRDGIDDRQYAAPLPSQLPDYSASLKKGVKGLKITILKEGFDFPIINPRVKAKVIEAAKRFKSLGAEVVEISVPLHTIAGHIVNCALRPAAAYQGYLGKACGRRGLYLSDLAQKMTPMDQSKFDKMFSTSKFTMISGLYLWENHPLIYGKAVNLYRRLRDEYNSALEQVDVLITPKNPYVANTHASPEAGPSEHMAKSRGVAVNTVCFNASGHPAMSLPVGFLPAEDDININLPVSMQIVGGMFQEEMIYRVGAAWEAAFDWKNL
ncbi:amidase signature domain-containing protein [Ilyonectria sp. MPI-CAGE-AT-0026]|nr:amidase signature domain-containing protein [Ilyonectria sp. MPI-CAGE-AT-0026]